MTVPFALSGEGPVSSTKYRDFDAFGRAGTVEAADGTLTTFSYTGQRLVQRTVSIHGPAGESPSTTTEAYDSQGRLVQVVEPSGTEGALVTTEYSYDAGGRLTEVCSRRSEVNGVRTCGQERLFTYDGRGYLNQEMHPEAGSTIYEGYDARGNVSIRRKQAASLFDQRFAYDSSGRLTDAYTRDPNALNQTIPASLVRPLETFRFGDANAGTGKGKLVSSTRHNYIPRTGGGEELISVREEHTYGDPAGRRSERLTTIRNESTGQTLQVLRQSVLYDDLGNVRTESYPVCEEVSCGTSSNRFSSVTRDYTLGRLSSVDSEAAVTRTVVSGITYHPNGMVAAIAHGNEVTETIAPDVSGMPRPGSISFSGFSEPPACTAPSIPGEGQPAGTTIPSGGSATLSVAATGSNLTYQWYQVAGAASEEIPGAVSASYTTPALTVTTSYWVRVTSTCGSESSSADSNTATVSIGASPTNLVAAAASPAVVNLVWSGVANVEFYEIERKYGGGTFGPAGTSATTSFADATAAGQAYAYRVRAKYIGGGTSGYTNVDIASTFTFAEALVGGTTTVKASHVIELRQAVDALRVTAGVSPYAWTNAVAAGSLIRALDLQELRAALDGARSSVGVAPLAYTDPSIVAGATVVTAAHWLELRDGVK